jgi:UDP-glucose 4-epimerase
MKTVLITGGLGYVGGRLAKMLVKSFSVLISSRGEINDPIRSVFGEDISYVGHESLLEANSFPKRIDAVIHLAAMNEIDSVKFPDEAIDININQTRKILEAAIQNGVSKFIYFSTIHVYGKELRGIIDEQALPRPIHPYAITHKAAEDYVIGAHDSGKIQGVIVRLSNSFGMPVLPTVNRWTLLVNDICRQAVTTGSIRLHSNGCQYRDFVTLSDVGYAIDFLLEKPVIDSENIFNLSSGKSMTVLAMSEFVVDISNQILKKKIAIQLPENSQPSIENSFQILPKQLCAMGFEFQNNFEEELKDMILFCNHHYKNGWTY